MIDLFDLLNKLRAEVNPQQRGHIRPQRNFVEWCNVVNQEIFEELARQMDKNNVISDKLAPFLRSVNVTLVPQPGQPFDLFTVPADYRYYSSARFLFAPGTSDRATGNPKCDTVDGQTGGVVGYVDEDEVALAQIAEGNSYREVPVRKIDNQRWGSMMRHQFKHPTANAPKITQIDERRYKVAPKGLGVITLDYLRPPKPAVFAYTTGPDDQIIYNPAGSTPLEWDTNVLPEFLARLASKYGVFVREDFVYQAGQLHRAQTKS